MTAGVDKGLSSIYFLWWTTLRDRITPLWPLSRWRN